MFTTFYDQAYVCVAHVTYYPCELLYAEIYIFSNLFGILSSS